MYDDLFFKKISYFIIVFSIAQCAVIPEETIPLAPGIYDVNREFYRMGILNAWAITYIEKIEILDDYQFKMHFKWVGDIDFGLIVYFKKGSDITNKNMYVTDNLDNRYDHTDNQGVGSFNLYNGEVKRGWFLFPPLDTKVRSITMHDGDQDKETTFYFQ